MTRKQAITKAIAALHQTGENAEAIRLLQDLSDELPLIHWSDKSIRDTVEQFILDNGRPPTVSDFKKAGMPPHMVIQNKYKMTLGQWLDQNYPTRKPSFDELKAKYTKAFIKDYNRIKPRSQYEFSEKKRPDTRSWQTVAAYYNTRSWRKLLSTLNLPLYNTLHRERVPQKITVAIHHDYDFRE